MTKTTTPEPTTTPEASPCTTAMPVTETTTPEPVTTTPEASPCTTAAPPSPCTTVPSVQRKYKSAQVPELQGQSFFQHVTGSSAMGFAVIGFFMTAVITGLAVRSFRARRSGHLKYV